MHCLTYHGIKEDEKSNRYHTSLRKEFDNSTRETFRTDISPDDFPDVNLEDSPRYEMFGDVTADA